MGFHPFLVSFPVSSFRPNKGTLGGGLEVVVYAARHYKVSRKIAVRKRHTFGDWSVVFL